MANDFSGNADLAALFNFDDGALTTDSSGEGNTLTDNNTVDQSVDVKQGDRSADFNGTDESLSRATADLSAGLPYKFGSANKKSLSTFWIKHTALDGIAQFVWGEWQGAAPTRTFRILTKENDDKLYLSIGHNSGNDLESSDLFDTAFVDNIWYHVGVWHDDSDKSWGMRIWDDNAGSLLDSNKTGTFTNNVSLTDILFAIGSNGDLAGAFFQGLLDELVIFNDYPGTEAGINTMIDQIQAGTYGAAGGNAPTGGINGPLVGSLGGPI